MRASRIGESLSAQTFEGAGFGVPFPEVPLERLSIFGSTFGLPDVDNSIRSQKTDEQERPQGGSTPWHRCESCSRP
jgi:hypothetical protein